MDRLQGVLANCAGCSSHKKLRVISGARQQFYELDDWLEVRIDIEVGI
jgi:hypothetical protein